MTTQTGIPLHGKLFNCPTDIASSGVVKVVGSERNTEGLRMRIHGGGKIVYTCIEILGGREVGFSFYVGSDELAGWEAVE